MANGGKIYAMHVKPVLIDCNFIVDSTNGNGLGIRSLKGPLVQNVFMNTSATPGAGNTNPATPGIQVTNPNPAPGTIIIQLQDTYNRSLSGFDARVAPLTGSAIPIDNSVLNIGQPYVITTLGNATLAQWQAVGVPAGTTPAVGVSFIAATTGAGSNTLTSRVQAPADNGSGIVSIETVGDPNTAMSANIATQGYGTYLILQCRHVAGLGSALAVAAPADGTVISLCFYLSDSSVTVAGET